MPLSQDGIIGDVARRYLGTPLPLLRLGSVVFGSAGRVWLVPIDVPWRMEIDALIYQTHGTSAGNVRLGLYREGATTDSPAGGNLIAETASVAMEAAHRMAIIPLVSAVTILPGRYWCGIQGDDITGTVWAHNETSATVGKSYDHGYGAFADPCPALTGRSDFPDLYLRVSSNLGVL